MNTNDIERARLLEHAVETAVGGLSRDEWLELRRQVGAAGLEQDDGFELAAAAIELARQPKLEPMPRHVAAAVAGDADRYYAPRRAPAIAPRSEARPAWFVYGGWIAAAASFVAAVGLVLLNRPSAAPGSAPMVAASGTDAGVDAETAQAGAGAEPRVGADDSAEAVGAGGTRGAAGGLAARGPAGASGGGAAGEGGPDAQRQALATQRFVLQRNWAPAGDPAGREVKGDVVWDARTQTGYMRFVGLRRNDPSNEQYQLWIFDGRRDERYPVDGGVFDVPGDGDEVIVPIRASLPVGTPLAFAVTIERPGGVVVSDRSRVVVIARVG
jgi:anti-sigma-K factor RskA